MGPFKKMNYQHSLTPSMALISRFQIIVYSYYIQIQVLILVQFGLFYSVAARNDFQEDCFQIVCNPSPNLYFII